MRWQKTAQLRARQGLGNRVSGLPFFRFSTRNAFDPFSPRPTPDAIRSIAQTLITDLEEARQVIDTIAAPATSEFVLNVEHLWFDIDQNGGRGEFETVSAAMAPILGRRTIRIAKEQASANGAPIIIRFDEADIHWLKAYTHMLSATAHMVMAFDPTSIIADLEKSRAMLAAAPSILPFEDLAQVRVRLDKLTEQQAKLRESIQSLNLKLQPLNETRSQMRKDLKAASDDKKEPLKADLAAIEPKIRDLNQELSTHRATQRFYRAEINSLKAKLPADPNKRRRDDFETFVPAIDSLYVLIEALRQDPDRAHIAAARIHWAEMIQSNQVFWQLVSLETDDDREWVPNAMQTSAIGIPIPPETAETWRSILREADAVVKGQLLMPHPLLPEGMGISLAAYFENPVPLDIPGWLHGRSSYPYARHGQRMSSANWRRLARLSRGNAAMFALFFN